MKKNLIKTFLSLGVLALVAASGMTIAQETYEVTIGNMNGYGILNLGRLIMRNSGGNPGIILDGAYSQSDYVIKVGPDLAAENNLSKLRVTNICDNKGNNCKKIADLSTGIKINGTNGLVCVKTNDKEINCNQTLGAGVITIKQGGISKGSFNVNTTSAQTIELSGAIALEGTNSRFCTKKDDNTIQCNVTTGAILNVSVQNPTLTNRGTTYTIGSVGGTEFKVTTPANPHKAGRNVVANTENGTSAGTTNNTNTYLNYTEGSDANSKSHIQIQGAGGTTVSAENNVITITSSTNGGGGDHITGKNIVGQYSSSTANNSSVTNNPYINHVENSQVTSSIQIKGSGATTVNKKDDVITIASTSPGNGTVTIKQGGVNKGSFTLNQSDNAEINLAAGGSDGGIELLDATLDKYCKYVQVTDKGITHTGIKCTYDASAGGDSLWQTATENIYYNNVHQNTTVLTPKSTTYPLYFNSDFYHNAAFNFYTYESNKLAGPSTRVTFDQKGIRLGNGKTFFTGAGLSVAGAVVVGNTSTDNYIYINASGNYNSPDKHFEILGKQELAVGIKDGAYMYFKNYSNGNDYKQHRIGINNKTPKATLDVNGSIRVNTNNTDCFPTCSSDSAGSIIYRGGEFYGCKDDGNRYKFNTTLSSSVSFTMSCTTYVSGPTANEM